MIKNLNSNDVDDDIQIEVVTRKINFGIRAMQTALKKYRDSIGKETKQHHYINELRLIKFAMTGDAKQTYDLSNPPREHLSTLRRVICKNRRLIGRLIGMHVPYAQRKQACRDFVLKKLTLTRT